MKIKSINMIIRYGKSSIKAQQSTVNEDITKYPTRKNSSLTKIKTQKFTW